VLIRVGQGQYQAAAVLGLRALTNAGTSAAR
jgi:hypothetical protein